jgi:glutathione S-transferase
MLLTVANKNYSSWSMRPWVALRAAKVAFDEAVIPLDTPESAAAIAKVSPSKRLPVLDDGAIKIWDSLAICEYAAERAPELWPRDPGLRAMARSVGCEMHAGFASMRAEMPMNVKRRRVAVRPSAECQADVRRVAEIFTWCRREHGAGGPWLFGSFSIADAMFAPVATRFRTYGVFLEGAAQEYLENLLAHEAVVEWEKGAMAETWAIAKYDAIG